MTDSEARDKFKIVHRSESLVAEPGELPAMPGLDFATVFEGQFQYVWHTLRRLGVPARDLEDVTHDVFLQVYRRREQYDPDRPLRAWLFAFAFRVACGYRRLYRNRCELLEPSSEPVDSGPSAIDHLVYEEKLDVAFQALDAIELGRRAVFILHELDGQGMPEVARTLGLPLNTAYSRLRLARKEFLQAARRICLRRGEP